MANQGILPRTAKLRDFFQSLRKELWRTDFASGTPVGRHYYENGIQGFASTLDIYIAYQASLEVLMTLGYLSMWEPQAISEPT